MSSDESVHKPRQGPPPPPTRKNLAKTNDIYAPERSIPRVALEPQARVTLQYLKSCLRIRYGTIRMYVCSCGRTTPKPNQNRTKTEPNNQTNTFLSPTAHENNHTNHTMRRLRPACHQTRTKSPGITTTLQARDHLHLCIEDYRGTRTNEADGLSLALLDSVQYHFSANNRTFDLQQFCRSTVCYKGWPGPDDV